MLEVGYIEIYLMDLYKYLKIEFYIYRDYDLCVFVIIFLC